MNASAVGESARPSKDSLRYQELGILDANPADPCKSKDAGIADQSIIISKHTANSETSDAAYVCIGVFWAAARDLAKNEPASTPDNTPCHLVCTL